MKYWQSWAVFICGLVVLFVGAGNYWAATLLSKWALIIIIASIALSVWVASRTSWWYFPLLSYSMFSLSTLCAWPLHPYIFKFDVVVSLALRDNFGVALMQVCALSVLAAIISRRSAEGVMYLLAIIWAAIALGYSTIHNPPDNGLWLGNPSMGAALMACLLPFVWANFKRSFSIMHVLSWAVTLYAIYRTKTSVPWGVLGVVTVAYFFALILPKKRLFVVFGGMFLALLMILLGEHLLGHDFWDQNNRFEIWRMAWNYFRNGEYSLLFGMGYGSLRVLLPVEQITTGHYHGDYFLWLHNDLLQLLIEGGAIGTVCLLVAMWKLFKTAFHSPIFFSGLCGFVVYAMFDYPLRMPIPSMCLALIIGMVCMLDKQAIVWPGICAQICFEGVQTCCSRLASLFGRLKLYSCNRSLDLSTHGKPLC